MRKELEVVYRFVSPPLVEVKTLSDADIAGSLSSFVAKVDNDGLSQTIKSFAKLGPLEERFQLHAVLHRDGYQHIDINQKGDGQFYLDGDYTLALGFLRGEQVRPLWIGVLSFSLGSNVGKYSEEVAEKLSFDSSLPVIVQIQGPTHGSYDVDEKYEDAKMVLGKLNWEEVLVTLHLEWAEYAGIPAVYLLPSSMNKYRRGLDDPLDPDDDRDKRLHVRYDDTARHLGLQLDDESGLFKALIDLSSNGDHPQRL
jgi:hypothetical protein